MSEDYEKPMWERCESKSMVKECFDLKAVNYDKINIIKIKNMFKKVQNSRADGQKISQNCINYFNEWIGSPNLPLKEEAYALLSNWFLTDKPNSKKSALSSNCEKLWNELFSTVPKRRLTSSESRKNHKIISVEFDLWWSKQEKCQGKLRQ